MTENLPGAKTRAASIALAVLAGVLGTALAAGAIWLAFRSPEAPSPKPPTQTAEETVTATTSPSPSEEPSESQPPAGGPDSEAPAPPSEVEPGEESKPKAPEQAAPLRAAKVAFRVGSNIYVAEEDGTGAKSVVRSASGPYSLSPDARTLAVIDDGELRLIEVKSGAVDEAGPALDSLRPCWEHDSSRVYFKRRSSKGKAQIWRVARSGGEAAFVLDGLQIGISPDGGLLVVRDGGEPLPDGSSFVHVSVKGAAFRPIRITGGLPTTVGTDGKLVFVGLSSGDRGSAIVSIRPDGRKQRQLAGAVPGLTPAVWGAICPSPDGSLLAIAALGDDGYSRAFVLPAEGGALLGLSQRRDTSLHSWSASGGRLFLIEGNAFQGEPTALISVKGDGSRRKAVVTGAQ